MKDLSRILNSDSFNADPVGPSAWLPREIVGQPFPQMQRELFWTIVNSETTAMNGFSTCILPNRLPSAVLCILNSCSRGRFLVLNSRSSFIADRMIDECCFQQWSWVAGWVGARVHVLCICHCNTTSLDSGRWVYGTQALEVLMEKAQQRLDMNDPDLSFVDRAVVTMSSASSHSAFHLSIAPCIARFPCCIPCHA